jgi:uncharacterized sulfatase
MALNIDLAPTILDYAGVPIPSSTQGRSLKPLVQQSPRTGEQPAGPGWRTDFFCEHLFHLPNRIPKWEGIRDERWMYACYFEQQPPYEFLHDLHADPQELVNLAATQPDHPQLQPMRRRMAELREALGGEYSRARFPSRESPALRPPTERRRLPNVVLIISDDQHYDDYSFRGHPAIRTPNLDRLADQSALFPRGYVPCSLCSPSLASILSGLYPSQHGITGNDPALPEGLSAAESAHDAGYQQTLERMIARFDRIPTLPRLLAQQGYVSFQSGKWWGGRFDRGGFTAGMTHGDRSRGGRHGDDGLAIGRRGLEPIFDFISANQDKPFFLWYAPMMPHAPHDPPEAILARYRTADRPIELARYYAMCDWFDQTCGQLLDFLDEKKLSEETLVIYICDNGWIQRTPRSAVPQGWNQNFLPRSKQSPYDGGLRTPILLRWPGTIEPGIREPAVSSVDIAPTILHAAGIDVPAVMPGIDLLPLANGGMTPERVIFGEVFAHDIADLSFPGESLLYSWCLDGRWKLIRTHAGKTGRYGVLHPQTRSELELYDMQSDPQERRDLAQTHPAERRRLQAELERWRDRLRLVNSESPD